MAHHTLEALDTVEFDAAVGVSPTAVGLRKSLASTVQVEALRAALRSGEILEEDVREFVGQLLARLRLGEHFESELALAAIAVALETRSTLFADEYLRDLSSLKLREMPRAIAVASVCRTERLKMPATRFRSFVMGQQPPLVRQYRENQRGPATDYTSIVQRLHAVA